MVEVPEPGAAIEVGLKLTVAPVGCPVAFSATAPLKLYSAAVVRVAVPVLPCTMLRVEADEATVKVGAAVTVSAMVVLWLMLPPVAFRTIE